MNFKLKLPLLFLLTLFCFDLSAREIIFTDSSKAQIGHAFELSSDELVITKKEFVATLWSVSYKCSHCACDEELIGAVKKSSKTLYNSISKNDKCAEYCFRQDGSFFNVFVTKPLKETKTKLGRNFKCKASVISSKSNGKILMVVVESMKITE